MNADCENVRNVGFFVGRDAVAEPISSISDGGVDAGDLFVVVVDIAGDRRRRLRGQQRRSQRDD